ncbi:uncharacterized protein LOC129717283 [Wyeomyia smithii]|uniref:uncharacterized protein LOC129717283 n=1 Tax=Wyeomyia smithii TaxID=174621 RepID=UPI002467D6A6|nr:uncharacterized protein LOC129717283 [Wyeomyia smithii]
MLKRRSKNTSVWEETDEMKEDHEQQTQSDNNEASDSDVEDLQNNQEESSDPEEKPTTILERKAKTKQKLVTPITKKRKAGIIYISTIPKHMNVTILRELLEPYGEVGRIYLLPERKEGKIRKKTAKGKRAMVRYTEGWVEFKRKRIAKAVVQHLNTRPISTKKKSVFCDILWSMKYLPRFKWIHLSERLAYERAIFKQKLRTEIAQARKEASFFQSSLDQSEAVRKKMKKAQKEANKV